MPTPRKTGRCEQSTSRNCSDGAGGRDSIDSSCSSIVVAPFAGRLLRVRPCSFPCTPQVQVTAQPLLHSCSAGCLTMSNGDSSAYCQHTRRKQLLERTCRFPFKERYFVLGVGPMPFATIDTNPDVFQQPIRHSRHLPMYWPSLTKGITTRLLLVAPYSWRPTSTLHSPLAESPSWRHDGRSRNVSTRPLPTVRISPRSRRRPQHAAIDV